MMSILTSGALPVLVLILLLFYWWWRTRIGQRREAGITEVEALAHIKQTLPPVWADLWTGRRPHRVFSLSFLKKPYTYFLGPADVGHLAPGLRGLCPLVERNGEAIIGWLPDGRFVQFYYEDALKGNDAIAVLGRNYQEFVLSLLLELEESGMREELVEFAGALRFAHTAELVLILDRDVAGDETLNAFRDRIAAEREAYI